MSIVAERIGGVGYAILVVPFTTAGVELPAYPLTGC